MNNIPHVYTKRKTEEMGDLNTGTQIHMHYKRKSTSYDFFLYKYSSANTAGRPKYILTPLKLLFIYYIHYSSLHRMWVAIWSSATAVDEASVHPSPPPLPCHGHPATPLKQSDHCFRTSEPVAAARWTTTKTCAL